MIAIVDTTFTGKNIAAGASVYEYTAAADLSLRIQVRLAAVAGGGDYTAWLTLNDGDAQSDDAMAPKTVYTAAAGQTAFWFPTITIDLLSGDVINVFIDGLAADTNEAGSVRIFADTARDIGLSVLVGDKTGFSLAATGADLIAYSSTFVQAIKTALEYAGGTLASLLARIIGTLDAGTHKPQSGDAYTKTPDAAHYTNARGDKIDNLDATVASRSNHSAADVWGVGTRTLTSFGTLASDVATAVWAAGGRTLSSFGTLIADIWGYATRTLTSASGPSAATIADAVWDEAAADHVAAGSTGQKLTASGAAADPLLNAVPGTYATGTAGAALGRVGVGQIVTVSPVAQSGDIEIIQGDDYPAGALVWTDINSAWPSLSGATIRFALAGDTEIAGYVVPFASPQQVGVVLSATQTRALRAGKRPFGVEATLAGTGYHETLLRGMASVLKEIVL